MERQKKSVAYIAATILIAAIGYLYLNSNSETNCRELGRELSDAWFISRSVDSFESEVDRHGGFDSFEKYFVSLNRNPEEAGRDFDKSDPECCEVIRGESNVELRCGMEYPVCVLLHFPKRKDHPHYYEREGRRYLFSKCGTLSESY